MSEEPTLPRLPAVSWDERSQSFSNNPRKRGRLPHASNAPSSAFNSSDPAVFSSDDDPALDNYVEGRRKKRYVGTWFSQHPTSSDSTFGEVTVNPRPKRTWARQLDSGVFLGSDDAESETMSECPPLPTQPRLRQLEVRPRRHLNAAELAAEKRIQQYVESGTEDVVLYSAGLTELSNETIAPLSHLTRIPIVGRDVAFEQHPTQIRLNLAANYLTKLPGALFDVTNLTMLTLRGNQFEELPGAIGKLCNLQTLNVSQNRLKYLPTELLDLLETSSKLNEVVMHPNPFLQPAESEPTGPVDRFVARRTDDEVLDWSDEPKLSLLFGTQRLGRSTRQLYDSRGRLVQGQALSDHKNGLVPVARWYAAPRGEQHESPSPHGSNSVPSLLEAVLRRCYDSEHLVEMQDLFCEGAPQLQALLQRAHEQKQYGGLRCSRCKKTMIIPACEWIEWRSIFKLSGDYSNSQGLLTALKYLPLTTAAGERIVPFLYRACSERCGPEQNPVSPWVIGQGWDVEQIQSATSTQDEARHG